MKNVVVYLVRGHEASIASLERSLTLLKRNFLPWSPADVLIFHEANLKPEQLEGRTAGVPVRTALVDFSEIPPAMASLPPSQRGYRHMCHFFANDIFHRDELSGYDYFMRLDDDSFILSPLMFDVFARMSERRFRYAYRAVLNDRPHVCVGLGDVVARHFRGGGMQVSSAIQDFLHELRDLRPRLVPRSGVAVLFCRDRSSGRYLESPLGRCADTLLRRYERAAAGGSLEYRRIALSSSGRVAAGATSENFMRDGSSLLGYRCVSNRRTGKSGSGRCVMTFRNERYVNGHYPLNLMFVFGLRWRLWMRNGSDLCSL